MLYSMGVLKINPSYKYHYFGKKMIKPGDYVLDIGANLGYFTKLFAKWAGKEGHVFAVEPVSIFAETLQWGTKRYKNITQYNCALGMEEREVTLATPGRFGYLRTGLPHITHDVGNGGYEYSFTASMKKGSLLFKDMPKLDYIKCDIEGYEEYVLPEIVDLLVKHKPIIQVETWGEQKPKVKAFLTGLGYEIFDVEDNTLKPIANMRKADQGDLLFIHKQKIAQTG